MVADVGFLGAAGAGLADPSTHGMHSAHYGAQTMTDAKIHAVCGHGRCGSSLVMQMLAAGGMAVTGRWPSFEDGRVLLQYDPATFVAAFGGHAVKILDLHKFHLPAGPEYRFLWLDRTPSEQAASHVKLMRQVMGMAMTRAEARYTASRFAASYAGDRRRAWREMERLSPVPPARTSFEGILRDPAAAARFLAEWTERDLDIPAMVRAVIPRKPSCHPTMLEFDLIRAGHPDAAAE